MKRILKSIGAEEELPKKVVPLDIEKGQAVRINSGAFEEFAATVADVDNSRGKLKVLVDMFGRETTVELDFDQVEKI